MRDYDKPPEDMVEQAVCPVCGASVAKVLCTSNNYPVMRCASCATDFVSPMPDQTSLRAYYDRAEWFEGGERGGYQDYDSQTAPLLPFFDKLLDEFGSDAGRSVLDIGCGYGTHLAHARQRGWECFGVEVSAYAREVIEKRYGHELFVVDDVAHLIPHEFDLVVLFDVIEHLADPYNLFYTLFSQGAITPQTVIVITTPNARSMSALSSPAGWAYRHPPSHLVYYSGETLVTLLRRLHFTSVDVQGLHPDSSPSVDGYSDESFPINDNIRSFAGLYCRASGSDFASFIHERYVPGTWSKLAEYEHLPRYLFARELAGDRHVLDFGCGTGYGTALLAQRAQSVIGIDIDDAALEWARVHHQADNLRFDQRTDLGLALPSGEFNLITCFEMIEHVSEELQIKAIHSFARLLSLNGLALISTPNPEVTKLYGPNPFHIREMSRSEFEDLLRGSFEFVEIIEQHIQPMVLITQQPFGSGNVTRRLEWSPSNSNAEPAVFVAVCSHQKLPVLDGACFLDFRTDFIAEQLRIMAELNDVRYAHYKVSREAAEAQLSICRLEHELEGTNRALSENQRYLAENRQELETLRLTSWCQLGDALRRPGLSINKLHDIAYYLGASIVPQRWKATIRRWIRSPRRPR